MKKRPGLARLKNIFQSVKLFTILTLFSAEHFDRKSLLRSFSQMVSMKFSNETRTETDATTASATTATTTTATTETTDTATTASPQLSPLKFLADKAFDYKSF